jgi:hypothetical protein
MSKNEIFYMLSVHETIEDLFSHALLSLWGREPCIGFFFGDSMRLTLLYVIQAL